MDPMTCQTRTAQGHMTGSHKTMIATTNHVLLSTIRRKVSRTGFLTRLKSKKVEIGKEKMSRMIIREKLSERAVMKERRLG